ncbi:hypothetical protein B0T18DRAFT_79717 [Schizothecium vesticola]|uniref:Uncharacterized protein n=1 Tax=Schizothecium vesticola TaxID=314040 RepID=A0AA40KAA4_9PEZI|nr:hypothetical protein B0T18DRAFT_79717 [Schizothecium vesticola]
MAAILKPPVSKPPSQRCQIINHPTPNLRVGSKYYKHPMTVCTRVNSTSPHTKHLSPYTACSPPSHEQSCRMTTVGTMTAGRAGIAATSFSLLFCCIRVRTEDCAVSLGVSGEMSIFTGTDLTTRPFPLPTTGGSPGTGLGCPWSLTCVVHQTSSLTLNELTLRLDRHVKEAGRRWSRLRRAAMSVCLMEFLHGHIPLGRERVRRR